MTLEHDDLQDLLDLLKASGVVSFRDGDLAIVFAPADPWQAMRAAPPPAPTEEAQPSQEPGDVYAEWEAEVKKSAAEGYKR